MRIFDRWAGRFHRSMDRRPMILGCNPCATRLRLVFTLQSRIRPHTRNLFIDCAAVDSRLRAPRYRTRLVARVQVFELGRYLATLRVKRCWRGRKNGESASFQTWTRFCNWKNGITRCVWLVISFLQNLAGLSRSLIPFRGEAWERLTTPLGNNILD